jgi:SAM-dependent methyltransferase
MTTSNSIRLKKRTVPRRAAAARNNSRRARQPANGDMRAEIERLQKEVDRLLKQSDQNLEAAPDALPVVPKNIPENVLAERQQWAEQVNVPGRNAPRFNLVSDYLTFGATPWADPLVPAYLLDRNYRIVDWNQAFSLAFDQTMEGRRGESVLEWVYFLDNFQEVLDRGVADFADPEHLPRLHVETIRYTSPRYGQLSAIKRAYQVPQEDNSIHGWLVTLETRFADLATTLQFKRDLFKMLRLDLVWSEYALSYDRVLLATDVYRELLDHILGDRVPSGGKGRLNRLADGARILDLGAGTGNLARRLAEQQRGHVIFALENNRTMLDLLREKCAGYLRDDDERPGVLAVKQDVNTLFGLPDESFDCAILNNVAYTLDDPIPCFRQVRAALKPGGEIRVSGPQKKTRLDRLFARIEADLKKSEKLESLRADFDEVWQVNHVILRPNLFRWTVVQMKDMLMQAGFREIVYATETAYSGEAMLVAARKS